MRLSAADICTANIAGVADGEWALISRFGEHPSPSRQYVQRFDQPQAEKLVAASNSLAGTAARIFKNLRHGLGWKTTIPVWEGHPDDDRQRWPKEKLLAEIEELRTSNAGLEGRVRWNTKGQSARASGPLHPSPLFLHWPPSGDPLAVYPELLESVGLWPQVNIAGMPSWTANAPAETSLADSPAEPQPTDPMNQEQFAALCRALNLPETTDPAEVIAAAQAAFQISTVHAVKLQEGETAIQTANAAAQTAASQLATLTTERDGLTTANTNLTSEVETLRKGVLDVAEKRGVITPGERVDFATRLSTANTAAAALSELQTRKPKLNTQPVEINGRRLDISTANARADVLQTEVQRRMKAENLDYSAAYAAVEKDPNFAAVFAAMQDPTKRTEA